jgi:hypothetical protein
MVLAYFFICEAQTLTKYVQNVLWSNDKPLSGHKTAEA